LDFNFEGQNNTYIFFKFVISLIFFIFDPFNLFAYLFETSGVKLNTPFRIFIISGLIAWIIHKIFRKECDETE